MLSNNEIDFLESLANKLDDTDKEQLNAIIEKQKTRKSDFMQKNDSFRKTDEGRVINKINSTIYQLKKKKTFTIKDEERIKKLLKEREEIRNRIKDKEKGENE